MAMPAVEQVQVRRMVVERSIQREKLVLSIKAFSEDIGILRFQ
jgi:hypothetical protein